MCNPVISTRTFFLCFLIVLILIPQGIKGLPGQASYVTGTESIVSTATWGTDQSYPAVWEDRIVWAHYYPSPEDPAMFNSDISFYNITSGEFGRFPTILPYLDKPDIWEDRIAWQVWEDDNLEIYFFNLTTAQEQRITNDQLNQVNPKIWGDWIVWQEGDDWESDHGVFLYSIPTGNVTRITSSSSAKSPVIWGDRVVWDEYTTGDGNFDIFLYNITTGNITHVTTDPYAQLSPSIWGDRIIWMDNRDISSQIYLYDLSSGNETRITSGDFYRQSPAIAGDYVVYVNDTVISLIDLSTMGEYAVSMDTTGSIKYEPDIWGNRIVWSDMRNGDFDIYLFTLGTSMVPLDADFTANITQGNPPLAVTFNDITSGQADGWSWNFGDGLLSEDRNPVHTYNSEGSYTVVLTVYNPLQRDAVRKTDLISVGSVPVPGFSQNQTSGPAPLAVHFTDESSGIPLNWSWDFGDGGTSEEQHPDYLYTKPGVYSVNLTTGNVFGIASVEKEDLITVMDGTFHDCTLPVVGIRLEPLQGNVSLTLNSSEAGTCTGDVPVDPETITCIPPEESGIAWIQFDSPEGSRFTGPENNTFTGILEDVEIGTNDLTHDNFSSKAGFLSFVNVTLEPDAYVPGGVIHSVIWEGCTPEDFQKFDTIKIMYNYGTIEDLVFTIRFDEEPAGFTGPATLVFAVSADWVRAYGWGDNGTLDIRSAPEGAQVYVDTVYRGLTPINVTNLDPGPHEVMLTSTGYQDYTMTMVVADERDSIHVIRMEDDGSGEVLHTTFIGYDPVQNLDLFRAESPNGLSMFGLASLSKSGNIFQIAQMTAAAVIRPSGGGGGGGGGSYSGSDWVSENTAARGTTSVPTQSPAPAPAGTQVTIESSGETVPVASVSPGITMESGEVAPAGNGEDQGTSFISSLTEGTTTLVVLKSLSVVFVVIFVTTVFYLRWWRKEE